MARIARAVHAGWPYHITHRGNRRGDVFFGEADRAAYLAELGRISADEGLEIWGYCLMTNHIHLIALPRHADSLARALRRAQGRHARRVNAARGWTGHLWANRFHSTALDAAHLWAAIKYVELNPARAGMVAAAEDWPWSSARAHGGLEPAPAWLSPNRPFGGDRPDPVTGRPIPWSEWLAMGVEAAAVDRLRRATATGRPCGSAEFVKELEDALGRNLRPGRRGRKPKDEPGGGTGEDLQGDMLT